MSEKRKCACGARNVVGDQLVLARNRRDTHSYEACLMFSKDQMCTRQVVKMMGPGEFARALNEYKPDVDGF